MHSHKRARTWRRAFPISRSTQSQIRDQTKTIVHAETDDLTYLYLFSHNYDDDNDGDRCIYKFFLSFHSWRKIVRKVRKQKKIEQETKTGK